MNKVSQQSANFLKSPLEHLLRYQPWSRIWVKITQCEIMDIFSKAEPFPSIIGRLQEKLAINNKQTN